MRRLISLVMACAVALLPTVVPAWAQISGADLMVAARAVGFIQNLGPGTVPVGIVYDDRSAQSEQQAHEIEALMGDGLRVANLVLKPTLLPLNAVGKSGAKLFFLTEGVGAAAQQMARASRERKIPCVTFDLDQVRAGNCTMGIRTQPRIEIIVNRKAADASGTDFTTIFRIMITEI